MKIRERGCLKRCSWRHADNRLWTLYIRQLRGRASRALEHDTAYEKWPRPMLDLRFADVLQWIEVLEQRLDSMRFLVVRVAEVHGKMGGYKINHENLDRVTLNLRFTEALCCIENLEQNLKNARAIIAEQAMHIMDVEQQYSDLLALVMKHEWHIYKVTRHGDIVEGECPWCYGDYPDHANNCFYCSQAKCDNSARSSNGSS